MADLSGQAIEIPIVSIAKDITVQVKLTGYRRWHLRLRVGIVLMRFAIWVSGMGFKMEDSELPPLPDPNKPSSKALELMFSSGFIEAWTTAREQDMLDSGANDANNSPS